MAALTALLAAVGNLAYLRGRLFLAELRLARRRLLMCIAGMLVASLFLTLTCIFGTLLLVMMAEPQNRVEVLAWLVGIYALAAAILTGTILYRLRHFQVLKATPEEFRLDRNRIMGR